MGWIAWVFLGLFIVIVVSRLSGRGRGRGPRGGVSDSGSTWSTPFVGGESGGGGSSSS